MLAVQPEPSAVKAYASLCQRIASRYIQKKIHAGSLCPYFLGLSTDDLAADCVATLFERDGKGRFIQLENYYSRIGWEQLPGDDLLSFTRRLVFSKVNQEFSRLCKENDPALEKLMRAIRSAARRTRSFSVSRRNGEVWLLARGRPGAPAGRNIMPPEVLEARLTPYLDKKTSVAQLLRRVASVLCGQEEYVRGYPLTGLALVVRLAFECTGALPESPTEDESALLRRGEFRRILASSVDTVQHHLCGKYVGSRKMSSRTYRATFRAVLEILSAEYLGDDGRGRTFFGHLARGLPGLTRRTYQHVYRSRLEYFVKKSRSQFLLAMRKEI